MINHDAAGYDRLRKGYIVELEDGKVTTTRDVQFMETKLLRNEAADGQGQWP
jgi:hypothetical protein